MVDIKVYKPIDKEDVFMSWFGFEDEIFNTEKIQQIFNENPDEKEYTFQINCDGGSVYEGLRMYDYLRAQEGYTYHCNIEGGCHSMAIVLLLAAAKENRTANPNARGLIHEVRTMVCNNATAQELRDLAESIEQEQSAILDIYANRTEWDREELENLMKEEKMRTAQELLQYGFISKINTYSTNLKTEKKMSKATKNSLVDKAKQFLADVVNLSNEESEPVNYEHKDAEGVVLFTTEKEDDSLAVGDPATPAGTFTLEDGRVVVIADVEGVEQITEINEATENESNEELEAENAAQAEQIETLTNKLTEATDLINELKNEITSDHTPEPRRNKPANKKNAPVVNTVADMKAEMKLKREQKRGGKA